MFAKSSRRTTTELLSEDQLSKNDYEKFTVVSLYY